MKRSKKQEPFIPSEPVFVPAKPGEEIPDIWIPNRKERRKMKKNQPRYDLFSGKDAMKDKAFKNELYKDLMEKMKELMKEKEDNGYFTEGDEDVQSGE